MVIKFYGGVVGFVVNYLLVNEIEYCQWKDGKLSQPHCGMAPLLYFVFVAFVASLYHSNVNTEGGAGTIFSLSD